MSKRTLKHFGVLGMHWGVHTSKEHATAMQAKVYAIARRIHNGPAFEKNVKYNIQNGVKAWGTLVSNHMAAEKRQARTALHRLMHPTPADNLANTIAIGGVIVGAILMKIATH